MQGSARALKAAPKLHNYNSTRDKNSDTQKYTYIIVNTRKTFTHP